jgi:carbamoyltransferase
MTDAPLVLGVTRMQDGGACLMQGTRILWAIQKERLTRQRHQRGAPGDLRDWYGPHLPWPARPPDAVVDCLAADEDARNPALYDEELAAALHLAPTCRRARISQHMAQVHGVFHPSPFRAAAVMVADDQGSPVTGLTDNWSGAAYVPGGWREASSFYRADRERVHCIGKQLWDGDDAQPAGPGMFYALLTRTLFPGEGNGGKTMALAAHGDARTLGLPPLIVAGGQVRIPPAWQDILGGPDHGPGRFRYGQAGVAFADCANLAAAGQRAFEEALVAVARWLHAETGLDDLCLAGAAALNGAANTRLLRETPFRNVFVAPAPGAAGAALGCAVYGLTALAGASDSYRWTHDYLGPPQPRQRIDAALAGADDLRIEHLPDPQVLCSRMVDLLCQDRVLGLYQGASEFGPRALAHRSILADPRSGAMRDWINARIKQRDWFLPLAALVLEERAGAWFDLPAPSPFMQYAAQARATHAPSVPAVVHVDGSARVQTVGPAGDPLLRLLLQGVEARTGVPVLLHGSFRGAMDGADEPLVETPSEALAAFRRMPLHALAMPPYLATKRAEPELPA